jgi:hypothetical protein
MVPRLEMLDSAAPARVTYSDDYGRTGQVQRNCAVTLVTVAKADIEVSKGSAKVSDPFRQISTAA